MLIKFLSLFSIVNETDDRYVSSTMEQIRFSTPVSDYKMINGFLLPSYGEAIWHYPEGKFVYGKFWVRDIKYNVGSYFNRELN